LATLTREKMKENEHLCNSCSREEFCNGEVIIRYRKINNDEGIIIACDHYNPKLILEEQE